MAESPTRDNIPLPVQRAVRQRCGFGCVVCGLPLYEYDHTLGWANVQRHVAEEITLLCDTHHREKTAVLLTDSQLKEANASPHNLKSGVSKPYALHYEGNQCEIVLGSNRFVATDSGYGTQVIPIAIDSAPILGFVLADGHLLFNLNLFDEYNELVLRIVNNHLAYSTTPWDIQFVGRRLIVRLAARQILVDVQFEPPNRVRIDRARFLRNGVEVIVWPESILVAGKPTQFAGCEWHNVSVGLSVGSRIEGVQVGIDIPSVSRYLGDNTEAIRWARQINWR